MVKKMKKKKKIKLIPFFCFLLFLVGGYFLLCFLFSLDIKNIYVYDNVFLSDQEIIDLSGIGDYKGFLKVSKSRIRKNILTSDYVEDVKVKKSFFGVIQIYVEEYRFILYNSTNEMVVLSNKTEKKMDGVILDIPILLNYVPDTIYDDFIFELCNVDEDVLKDISEIEYSPNSYDKERFLLYMNDGNYVYINIDRFSNINYYEEIYPNLDNKKGILYLDSGNHFEPF